MVTGGFQLTSEELESKFGLALDTTQCCASGTCDVSTGIGTATPVGFAAIDLTLDGADVDALVAVFGTIA